MLDFSTRYTTLTRRTKKVEITCLKLLDESEKTKCWKFVGEKNMEKSIYTIVRYQIFKQKKNMNILNNNFRKKEICRKKKTKNKFKRMIISM